MNKEEAIKFIESFEGDNIEIINPDKATENEFFKKQINEATGKAYQEVDNVLNEIGLDKQGKTSETVKYHFTSFKQKLDKLTDIEKTYATTLEELEDVKKNGIKDTKVVEELTGLKSRLQELEEIRNKEKTEYQTKLDEKDNAITTDKINNMLNSALPENLNSDDKEYLNFKVNVAINDIKEKYNVSLVDDKLSIAAKDNSYTTFEADALLKDALQPLIGKTPNVNGKPPKDVITLGNAATRMELMDAVTKQLDSEGLKPTQTEYHERKQVLLKENNYENLK